MIREVGTNSLLYYFVTAEERQTKFFDFLFIQTKLTNHIIISNRNKYFALTFSLSYYFPLLNKIRRTLTLHWFKNMTGEDFPTSANGR